jgi:HEAT repeat protein
MPTIDAVKQAEELAQIFFGLSNAVNDFRLRPDNFNALSDARQQQLKDQAQALTLRGQQCTAEALGAILQDIQPHLASIKQATQDAKDALAHLNDVEKAITIVDAAVALVGSIMTGDMGSVGDNVQGLLQALVPAKKS